MKRPAFTLIELLVVVSVIALLVTILVPSVTVALSMARSALCRHNLHQLADAFHAHAAATASRRDDGLSRPLHQPESWPNIPMSTVTEKQIYICPEEPIASGDLTQYCIHSNYDGTSFNGLGLDIRFDDGEDCCKVLNETDEYIEYGFDDGRINDLDYGTIDITIRVTKSPPIIGTYMSDRYRGYNGSDGVGVLSLHCNGQVVPGWEDFRNVPQGATFNIGGAPSNYGMNARAGRVDLSPDTIVLLDYPRLLANDGEDMTNALAKAAKRHRGTINVLLADGSVRGLLAVQLDPGIGENAERWSP